MSRGWFGFSSRKYFFKLMGIKEEKKGKFLGVMEGVAWLRLV